MFVVLARFGFLVGLLEWFGLLVLLILVKFFGWRFAWLDFGPDFEFVACVWVVCGFVGWFDVVVVVSTLVLWFAGCRSV